jgi:hypothetical protein
LGLLNSLSFGPEPLPPPGWLPAVHTVTDHLVVVLLLVGAAGWIWVAVPARRARDRYLAPIA